MKSILEINSVGSAENGFRTGRKGLLHSVPPAEQPWKGMTLSARIAHPKSISLPDRKSLNISSGRFAALVECFWTHLNLERAVDRSILNVRY